ncbi:S-layer homology domain-containing protein [Alkaliphilus serpentinus]|uniref:S-layer homology domain-containing protein n=1 Tax=Alkaliphilus serpentinus TaxID=1482731 RepID=A0A833M8Y3_9FIRM|nr:S-layer homology domain-containing protein [Alkaliphilus serpentinus]KAB3531866.1 S-layer homology domain-containing protein [Alkaliphilus serpentinus]
MKKKLILILMVVMLSLTTQSFALIIPGYEGGISNEMLYQEVIFVTGEAILLEGTLDVRKTERDNSGTERYTYRLENLEKGAELSRTVNLSKTIEVIGDQKTEVYTVTSFRETIEVNGVNYEVDQRNMQWSKSNVFQTKPGVTYFAGNWNGRKHYTVNDGEGKLMVETMGTLVGYDQHWGRTENQTLEHYLQYEGTGEDAITWEATAKVEAVHNRTMDYSYEANNPTQISFRGGFVITQQEENVLKVSYDLPRLEEDGSVKSQRNIDTVSFSLDTNPTNQRLIIPAMRDVSGHWAEENILLLASLGAVYPDSTNFGPSLEMTRGDFARAVAVAMGLPVEEPPTQQRSVTTVEETPLFLDVNSDDENAKYIKAVTEKGIMNGKGHGRFYPNDSLTKAEATVVLIRLLGFEDLAPIQQYSTGFSDDSQLPNWGKDCVYVAKELGLVQGSGNYFYPNKALTKAEAVTMLTNLINYLQYELRFDYRENLLNY